MIGAVQIEDRQLMQALDAFPQNLQRGIERGLHRATERLRAAVTTLAQSPLGAPSNAFGEFAGSVTAAVGGSRGAAIGSGAQRQDAVLGSVFLAPPADRYGLFVEVGTRPHFPPPAALEGWVRRRLGIRGDREAREVAFLIGRKIARTGTKGHFFFERALRENESRVVAVMEQEVAKAIG
jgi:hypothetical protein